MEPVVARLRNPVRDYAWGSYEVLAQLEGRPVPSPTPEAELWLGAHTSDPSTWVTDDAPRRLDEVIASDPLHTLGSAVLARFGPQLPFLLKVLAVARPLSLQAHPNAEQARAGFERERAAGIALDAAERNYSDPSPKPELIRALTPFDALCGFRALDGTLDLLDRLSVPTLDEIARSLRSRGPAALPDAVAHLLTMPREERVDLVRAVARGAARPDVRARWADEARWLQVLAERYPDDPGVAVAALLELIRLEPGESLHVPAGTLHSYLSGAGVEIMASSDSVLRGGLTDKHIDVPELLDVLEVGAGRTDRVAVVDDGVERIHPTPAPHFRLSELRPEDGSARLDDRGGQILLAIDGDVTVEADTTRLELAAGQSAFVAAAATQVTITGTATVFRATVGDEARG